jgi:glycosyltransferase involved in cell wall biosynthesis
MNQELQSSQSQDSRKRILIVGDSIKRKTGYATVARNIIKNLYPLQKYKVAQLGLADIPTQLEFPIQYYSNIKHHSSCCGKGRVIEFVEENSDTVQYLELDPFSSLNKNQTICKNAANEEQDSYGYDSVYFVIEHFKPDIVIPINDIWGLYNILHLKNTNKFTFAPYLAIDSECMFPIISAPQDRPGLPHIDPIDTIATSQYPIVFTDWAKGVINRTARVVKGSDLTHIEVIPHGVDTTIWKPLPNKEFLRDKYFHIKPTDNVFLLGSLNRNQPRKRLDAILQTLQLLKTNYPKLMVKCHFHCCLDDRIGWNLLWLAKYYDVEDRCIFDKNLKPGVGPSDEIMNEIVNCYDAHIGLTNSEGWGLSFLETAAAGIPNIVTKYSAMADWGKDTFMFVEPAAYEHEARTGFVKAVADIRKAAQCVKLLADSPKLRQEYIKKSIKLGLKLDWAKVCREHWEPLLDKIKVLDSNRWTSLKLDHKTFSWINIPEDPTTTEFELPEV